MIHLGDVPALTTIYIPFTTYAGSTGASVTCSGLAVTDVEIYKNGSVTQRSSDAGIALLDTDGIDFDGITGLHGFSIDLSNNTDSGFFAVGSWYWVVVSAITVDSQTVTFLAATFRIGVAETSAGTKDVGLVDGAITNLKLAANSGLKPLYVGAVTSGSATTYVMSGVTAANDNLNGYRLRITSGAMIGQVRMIKDWVSGTSTLELDAAFSTALSAADTFVIEPAQVNVKHVNDQLASGAGTPDVNVASTSTGAITSSSFAAGAINAAAIASDAITDAKVASDVTIASVTGAVGSVTGSVGGNVTGSVGSVVGAVGSVTGAVGSVTGDVGGNVTGSVGSLASQAKADVNAEVLDVLSTDTFAELGAIPAATSSLKDKLTWMFMWFRNKIEQTATTKVLKADNGTTTVATFTESYEAGTYTSEEGT